MRLSRTAKVVLGLSVVLAICLFLIIVDLGVNAGRIHYGVRLDHINLGGLTEPEAASILEQRGLRMAQSPIVFHKHGVKCTFLRATVGWTARVHRAVADALAVGREGSLIHAGSQRLQSWFGGVKVYWSDQAKSHELAALLDRCQARAAKAGLQVSRWKLRRRVRRALIAWPKRRFHIPLLTS